MKISKSDRQTTVDRHHQLEAAVDLAIAQLGDLTQSSDGIDRLDLAFGSNWNRTQGLRLLQNWAMGKRLPQIEVVAAAKINGANGAFDSTSGKIYISQDLLDRHQPDFLNSVLLEEFGHYFDSKVNSQDSLGDEGAIFAKLVRDKQISSSDLANLRQTNDHTQVTIDGKVHELELNGTYGNITVDGNLADWTPADRLDTLPATQQAGQEVYGKYNANNYLFALKSNTVIGANTTIWLNTDQNRSTGYQVFGFAGGDEYNINIDPATGKANLYSGAAGQTFVSSLDYALGADGKSLEVAVPISQLTGAPTAIDVLADINDSIFLPGDYDLYKYTVSQTQPKTTYGDIKLDGSLTDWNSSNRLDYLPTTQVAGQAIYGKNTADGYVFALQSDRAIGTNTTIWLNTDRNAQTGYQVFGFAGGDEYSINIQSDGQAYLYKATSANTQTQVAKLDSAKSADGKIFEVAVGKTLLPATPQGIDVLADVNDSVFIPGDYSNTKYTVSPDIAPAIARTDLNKKVAIVYSETSANKYFDKKSYVQLIESAQNQAMMAGIPFDLISENDLTNLSKLVNYDTIVFPSFINVQSSQLDAITSTLNTAVYKYNIGLVTSGNFMTNNETGAAIAGDPYVRMKNLLGVAPNSTLGVLPSVITAKDTSSPVFQQSYTNGEVIDNFAQLFVSTYNPTDPTKSKVVAEETVNGQKYNAVLQTTTGGRNVHFSDPTVFANTNLAWQAMQWSVYDNKPKAALHMGRDQSIFVGRDDVDQSKFSDEASIVESKLTTILTEWKQKYNFVSSHYINIGNNPAAGESTNWAVMAPIYKKWLQLGNEIGTHSYTHPDATSNLTATQLEFEFNQSKLEIAKQLGINVTGAATPGNPESLFVDQELQKYFDYASGVGSSYDNAFGYIAPGSQTVFLTPNTSFDFTLIGFQKLNATQAGQKWGQEYQNLKTHANQPIIMMPWHDYGPTLSQPGYTKALYDNFIARAYNDGTEFVTMNDLSQRIKTFDNAQFNLTQTGTNTLTASVISNDVGKFGIDVGGGQKIASVANWYAYDADTVFLPKNGGNFTINLGATPTAVTHITKLPMRAELVSLSGDGQNLTYNFNGEGTVALTLATPLGKVATIEGADNATISGDKVTMTFNNNGAHTAKISFATGTTPKIVNASQPALASAKLVAPDAQASAAPVDPIVGLPQGTTLPSTSGKDSFILGDATKVYFDDGNPNTPGLSDYGLIKDFSIAQGDIIQLKGQASDYQFADSPFGVGKAIYHNEPPAIGGVAEGMDPKSELIGVLQGGDLNLSLTGSYFQYV